MVSVCLLSTKPRDLNTMPRPRNADLLPFQKIGQVSRSHTRPCFAGPERRRRVLAWSFYTHCFPRASSGLDSISDCRDRGALPRNESAPRARFREQAAVWCERRDCARVAKSDRAVQIRGSSPTPRPTCNCHIEIARLALLGSQHAGGRPARVGRGFVAPESPRNGCVLNLRFTSVHSRSV